MANRPTIVQRPAAPGNYGIGRRNKISRITWHHIVGDAPASIARFQTPGVEVSATYSIGSDGTIYQHVDENNTPYSDGNADSNSRTISIEHAGGNAATPYTEAMYTASIQLVAYLIQKYGITDFKRHRDVIDKTVYPGGTLCPGELDVERIVSKAKEQKLMNKDTVYNFYREAFHRDPTDEEYKTWVGKSMEDLFYGGGKAQYAWLWSQLEGTQQALTNAKSSTNIDPKILNVAAAIVDALRG